jgi:hydroxymethylpyrimidine/phosphomethylpyrimidine kinase
MTPVVATVGTTHPLAFAGLPHALLVLAAEGVRPVCVVVGVSAQDAAHVLARSDVDAATIAAQFAALRAADVRAFHVGALLSAGAVHAVARGLADVSVPVVVDPVLAASGGDALADGAARDALRTELIPRATLLTPNLDEAGALLGRPITDVPAMREAARALHALGARAVLVKGGHLAGDAVDVLVDASGVYELRGPRLAAFVRGSGDLLAAAAAAALARGLDLRAAVEHARARVRAALADAVPFAGTRVRRIGP